MICVVEPHARDGRRLRRLLREQHRAPPPTEPPRAALAKERVRQRCEARCRGGRPQSRIQRGDQIEKQGRAPSPRVTRGLEGCALSLRTSAGPYAPVRRGESTGRCHLARRRYRKRSARDARRTGSSTKLPPHGRSSERRTALRTAPLQRSLSANSVVEWSTAGTLGTPCEPRPAQEGRGRTRAPNEVARARRR